MTGYDRVEVVMVREDRQRASMRVAGVAHEAGA